MGLMWPFLAHRDKYYHLETLVFTRLGMAIEISFVDLRSVTLILSRPGAI